VSNLKPHAFWHPKKAFGRLIVALAVGLAATWLSAAVAPNQIPLHLRGVVGWDAGAVTFLLLAWRIIALSTPHATQLRASTEDSGRIAVWILTVLASGLSLFAAVFVFRRVRVWPGVVGDVWTALALLAVACSWLTTHTLYTFRYARLYYRTGDARGSAGGGGLEFPGGHKPSDMDFAYYAFTVGMCFQVSDVTISCARLRRATLGHALLSFVYNTTIVALAINLALTTLGN
jgi:uncharacterized membrane protein